MLTLFCVLSDHDHDYTLEKSLLSYRFKIPCNAHADSYWTQRQKLPWDDNFFLRKRIIAEKVSVYPETVKLWCRSHKPTVFGISHFCWTLTFFSLGICKAAWRILKVHEWMLEQLKTSEMESSPLKCWCSIPVKETRPLRGNPALIGRVQLECQEQPKAGDFQSCLTTNPLPKSPP